MTGLAVAAALTLGGAAQASSAGSGSGGSGSGGASASPSPSAPSGGSHDEDRAPCAVVLHEVKEGSGHAKGDETAKDGRVTKGTERVPDLKLLKPGGLLQRNSLPGEEGHEWHEAPEPPSSPEPPNSPEPSEPPRSPEPSEPPQSPEPSAPPQSPEPSEPPRQDDGQRFHPAPGEGDWFIPHFEAKPGAKVKCKVTETRDGGKVIAYEVTVTELGDDKKKGGKKRIISRHHDAVETEKGDKLTARILGLPNRD